MTQVFKCRAVAPISRVLGDDYGGKMRYSALRILREGLTGNKGWTPVWREPDPKPQYTLS